MTERLEWLSSSDLEWAANYLLSKVQEPQAARELKSPNRNYSSVVFVIKSLMITDRGKLLIFKMRNALRQRRRRKIHKEGSIILPQETIKQIKTISRKERISEADLVRISLNKISDLEKFHERKIKEIKDSEKLKRTKLKDIITGYQERLKAAYSIIEENIENILIIKHITSKGLLPEEELKKAEATVEKELDKKMSTAIRQISLAARVALIELDA